VASDIYWNDQHVWVSNVVLNRLLDYAEEVGRAKAKDDQERAIVEKLTAWRVIKYFPGINFDLNEVFPTDAEKMLWACWFQDIARHVFLRRLGTHELTFWQSETIAVAYMTGRWLTDAVRQANREWYPETEDSLEAGERYRRGLNN
jgi:hypothetical protein